MSNESPTHALRLVPVEPTREQWLWAARIVRELGPSMSPGAMAMMMERLAEKAAPASPLPEGGWRTDFENAPKDGSVFMVGYDDEAAKKAGLFENKDRVYEARWNDIQSTWSARNGFILHSDATHWMPLPAAPTGAA